MKKLSAICALLLLSACGSGSNSYEVGPGTGAPGAPAPTPAPPVSMVDTFFSLVTSYLNPTGEDTDATPIDSVVSTQPEDTEPVELT